MQQVLNTPSGSASDPFGAFVKTGSKIVKITARIRTTNEVKETAIAVEVDLKTLYSWLNSSFFLKAGNEKMINIYGIEKATFASSCRASKKLPKCFPKKDIAKINIQTINACIHIAF